MRKIVKWINRICIVLDAFMVCGYIWVEDYPGAIFWLLMMTGMVLVNCYNGDD